MLLVIALFVHIYYTMSVAQYKAREVENIRTISRVQLRQMEDVVSSMNSAFTFILSDMDVLDALGELSVLQVASFQELFFSEAATTIRLRIGSFYLSDAFHRIIVFNENGNVVANNIIRSQTTTDPSYVIENYPWWNQMEEGSRNYLLVGIHEDSWEAPGGTRVMSLVREVIGKNNTFIEIQFPKEELDEIFLVEDGTLMGMFFTTDGQLLYTTNPEVYPEHYLDILKDSDEGIQEFVGSTGESMVGMVVESDHHNIKLFTMLPMDIRENVARSILPTVLLFLMGGVAVSILYVYFTSRGLTKPIHELQLFMENTKFENMRDLSMPDKISNDEIESLYISYKEVLEGLSDAMRKEERLSMMQLQAQFDLLQAQVNPHFIFNVLNVISSRGVLSGDDKICEICKELAELLRYSTNTKEKYATVKQEVEYLESYLRLLKYRYDHKLSYEINMDEEIAHGLMPRIALQQFVENSIQHGYDNNGKSIEIQVIGEKIEEGYQIRIKDNGSGISEEKIQEMEESMEEIRVKLSKNRHHMELEIGGMGLVNTYARLYILYTEDLIFKINSIEGQGTEVIIGVNC